MAKHGSNKKKSVGTNISKSRFLNFKKFHIICKKISLPFVRYQLKLQLKDNFLYRGNSKTVKRKHGSGENCK